MILQKDPFDPDAVFHDDIVDSDVRPYLSLAIDGLTGWHDGRKGALELRPGDVAANEETSPDSTMPVVVLDPEHLDAHGWQFNLWKKIKGYFGI